MLELKNVVKTYETKSGKVNALNGLSLTFPEKGMVFISGKSGCGKTTLLNVIGGLDGIDGGEISLFGKEFSAFSASEYDSYRNTFIGFIFQEYNLLSEFTVEKNIKIAMELQGENVDQAELDELLDKVEIKELKNRKPRELSGGQRQRVAIARALVKNPRIIMADEPTGALDSNTGIQVLDILKKLSKEKLVIVVSHDNEFAEKYADRIIRLVDGRIEEDVSFTENEVEKNIGEKGDVVIVKNGADLSSIEKDELASAIKNRKKIEFIDKLSYREKEPTGKVETIVPDKPVKFKKSKMKFSSSLALGVKSLGVKPLRLVFTILLSAIAFAVFGLFDTVANFKTESVINNLLRMSPAPSVSIYANYVSDKSMGDDSEIKFSEKKKQELETITGYKMKEVYNFSINAQGRVTEEYGILQLKASDVVKGKKYYNKSINGIIEFSDSEFEDGVITQFGYKLIHGVYPKLRDTSPVERKESLKEVAISSFMAESIMHYLNGKEIEKEVLQSPKDIIGKTITVANEDFKVVGIIDCGEIPEKYNILKESSGTAYRALAEDMLSYVDSGAYRCLFVADGFYDARMSDGNKGTVYYGGDATFVSLPKDFINRRYSTYQYFYSVNDYDQANVILFNGEYGEGSSVGLKDGQVLIHVQNLKEFYSAEVNKKIEESEFDVTVGARADLLFKEIETATNKEELEEKVGNLLEFIYGTDPIELKKVDIIKTAKESQVKTTGEYEVAGIYTGIDIDSDPLEYNFKYMVNDYFFSSFGICADQGEYSRLIFPAQKNAKSSEYIATQMCLESGYTLEWYGNGIIETVKYNEEIIRQAADLFLYVALVLALFSVFMLFNYISTSIASKRQSIGVLRGLGSGGKDVLIMFLSESLIISLINAILASIIAWVGCIFVNKYIIEIMGIGVPFALFEVRQILLILGASILTAIVSSALPIIKIAKEKPVELIRRF